MFMIIENKLNSQLMTTFEGYTIKVNKTEQI